MAFYEEEETSNSAYIDLKINDMEKGKAVIFAKYETTVGTSSDFGDFDIWNGVSFATSAKSVDEAIASLKMASIVPNKLIQSKYEGKAIKDIAFYKYEKLWNKGDKYNGNKTCKGFGYKVSVLKMPEEVLAAAREFHAKELQGPVQAIDTTGEEAIVPTETNLDV